MIVAATHSMLGALVVPGLVGVMVLPAFVARMLGWGDTPAEREARDAR